MEPHAHFMELRHRILTTMGGQQQEYQQYDWLYGALGDPGSDVMFVCENPSRAGVESADTHFGHLDIDAQWRGWRPEKRFRPALCATGLKCGGPGEVGGWRCYITNVIKSMYVVGDFNALSWAEKARLARRWEVCRVKPKVVFCVGWKSWRMVRLLQEKGHIDLGSASPHRTWHYSARGSHSEVRDKIQRCIEKGMAAVDRGSATPANAINCRDDATSA